MKGEFPHPDMTYTGVVNPYWINIAERYLIRAAVLGVVEDLTKAIEWQQLKEELAQELERAWNHKVGASGA